MVGVASRLVGVRVNTWASSSMLSIRVSTRASSAMLSIEVITRTSSGMLGIGMSTRTSSGMLCVLMGCCVLRVGMIQRLRTRVRGGRTTVRARTGASGSMLRVGMVHRLRTCMCTRSTGARGRRATVRVNSRVLSTRLVVVLSGQTRISGGMRSLVSLLVGLVDLAVGLVDLVVGLMDLAVGLVDLVVGLMDLAVGLVLGLAVGLVLELVVGLVLELIVVLVLSEIWSVPSTSSITESVLGSRSTIPRAGKVLNNRRRFVGAIRWPLSHGRSRGGSESSSEKSGRLGNHYERDMKG